RHPRGAPAGGGEALRGELLTVRQERADLAAVAVQIPGPQDTLLGRLAVRHDAGHDDVLAVAGHASHGADLPGQGVDDGIHVVERGSSRDTRDVTAGSDDLRTSRS